MSNMNNELVKSLEDQIEILKSTLDNIDKGIGASGQTLSPLAKNSIKSATNKQKNLTILVKELVAQLTGAPKLTAAAKETLDLLCNPNAKGNSAAALVHEGDDIFELIKIYEKAHPYGKDVQSKLMKAADEAGLELECVTLPDGRVFKGSKLVRKATAEVIKTEAPKVKAPTAGDKLRNPRLVNTKLVDDEDDEDESDDEVEAAMAAAAAKAKRTAAAERIKAIKAKRANS